jgi:hypothetical protein|tara:strand:+ start:1263 stop:2171 length:909 start_codon:yes stop_codon:yes gene_type:complete
MINYVKREDLEVVKYNDCIENSIQSRIYAFSWYLDIVADNWDVLVLNDYEAVMPIPWRKKYGIKYVYQPLWILEIGIFSCDINLNLESFLNSLFARFKFVACRLNSDNIFNANKEYLLDKQFQALSLVEDYETIFNQFRKDRKKDLRKAAHLNLIENWNDKSDKLIALFKNNVGKRTPNILENDYVVLEKLIASCLEKKTGEILSIYDKDNYLVASGFFLINKGYVTILVSSTDFENRNNGANTFLIDRAIFKYQKNFKIFNFGGSSMQSIAKYFLSFGAETKVYQYLKYHKLPFLLRLFKK